MGQIPPAINNPTISVADTSGTLNFVDTSQLVPYRGKPLFVPPERLIHTFHVVIKLQDSQCLPIGNG